MKGINKEKCKHQETRRQKKLQKYCIKPSVGCLQPILFTARADHRTDKLLVHLIKRKKRQKAQTWKIKRSIHFNLYEGKKQSSFFPFIKSE